MISPSTFLVAQVTAVNPDDRSLTVQVVGSDRLIVDVCVVNNSGNFCMPQEHDFVLILSTAATAYAIGIVQMDYKGKTERKKIKDPVTQKYVRADVVDPGGITIGNITNKTKLTIDNNGDFSFWSSLLAGLSFESLRQILSIASGTVNTSAGTAISYLGNVYRQMPGTGNTPLQAIAPIDITGIPGFSAVESVFDLFYQQFRIVRLHLGHIFTDKGIPEFSSVDPTKPLRAILEVCLKNVTSCSLKMDEGGNIEVKTLLGKVVIDSSIPLGSILLGGLTSTQSAVFGDLLLTWLNSHTHSSSWGPTGPAISPATSALLSTKVKIG